MLVPSPRLIACSLPVLPLALLPLMGSGWLWVPVFYLLLLLLVALLDLVWERGEGPALEFFPPEELRLAKGRSGDLKLRFKVLRSLQACRVGIPFAPELGVEEQEQQLQAVQEGEKRSVSWSLSPHERGVYESDTVFLQMLSRLGLWELRSRIPCPVTYKVHPDLQRERKALANLFLNRGLSGLRLQKIAGRGRDYDQLREYRMGDTLADIHWKATAKRNSLMARTYQIERTQEVYIVIDHSRLSSRPQPFADGERAEAVLERFVTVANILAMTAIREGDLIGFMAFARITDRYIPAGSGTSHLRELQNGIFQLRPEAVYPDVDEWVRFTRSRVRRRSLIILLTDLSDATTFELLEQRVSLLSRTHMVVVAMIPPPGVNQLFATTKPDPDPWRDLAGHLLWRELQGYRKRLQALGVTLLLPAADRLAVDVVDEYLTLKQQQRL